MKTLIIIIVAVAVVGLIIKAWLSSSNSANDVSRPLNLEKPTTPKDNDKIIVVNHANHEDIKKALTEFCNLYNKNHYAAMPRLQQLSPDSFVVTFPFDTDFATFCFAVNFMKYPIDIKWKADVKGWTTTRPGDDWITDENANKKIMLFLDPNDKEYDNVFISTDENVVYKLSFAGRRAKPSPTTPESVYHAPTIHFNEIENIAHEDFH